MSERAPFVAESGAIVARARTHSMHASRGGIEWRDGTTTLLTLLATEVTRGSTRLGRAGSPRVLAGGELSRDVGDGILERFVAGRTSEQLWTLAHEPRGDGDLVVRVPFVGAELTSSDENGLHFVTGGRSIAYSHATFVDADGRRAHVAAAVVDRAIELRVPASVLDGATYPAVLDPAITAPTVLAASLATNSPTIGVQSGPVVDEFGSNLVSAWLERVTPNTWTIEARVLDASGFATTDIVHVDTDVGLRAPSISCGVSHCAIAYAKNGRVLVRRMTLSGTFVDATPIDMAGVTALVQVSVVALGDAYVVAWTDAVGTYTNVNSRTISAGGVISGFVRNLHAVAGGGRVVAAARHPTTALIVWDEGANGGAIYGMHVDYVGNQIEGARVTLFDAAGASESTPMLALRASDMVIAFRDGTKIRGATVPLGMVLTLPSMMTATTLYDATFPLQGVAMSGNGMDAVLGWARNVSTGANPKIEIATAQIPSVLSTVSPATRLGDIDYMAGIGVAKSTSSASAVVVAAPLRVLAYPGPCTYQYDVVSLSSGGWSIVSSAAASTSSASASYDGSQFIVGYLEMDAYFGSRVSAVRFSPQGARLDATPITIADGSLSAANSTSFWDVAAGTIAGQHQIAYQTRTVGTTPAAPASWISSVDDAPTPVVSGARLVALGAANNIALVSGYASGALLWADTNLNSFRVDVSPTAIGTSTSVGSLGYYTFANGEVGLFSNGTNWSLVRSSASGVRSFSDTSANAEADGIARGRTSVLRVRRDNINIFATGVFGQMVDYDGNAVTVPTFPIFSGPGPYGAARVAFDGSYFDVVTSVAGVLKLVRIDESGAVVDATPFTLATDATGYQEEFSVVSDGEGRVLVAYDTFDTTTDVRAERIEVIVVDWTVPGSGAANGSACARGSTCASSYCIDGVCCDSPCGLGSGDVCGACSVAAGALIDGTCSSAPLGTPCRAAVGSCDAPETCDGVAPRCPVDQLSPAGTLCGALGSTACETDARCTGASIACPANRPAPNTTICRPSASSCDAPENCTGASIVCPIDRAAPPTTPCRASAGPCDVAELCNGSSLTCPADMLVPPNGAVCRAATSSCDSDEFCDGASAACPVDHPAIAGTTCRSATGSCDAVEACDGVSFACPPDAASASGTTCRAAIGACDIAETCNGASKNCPATDVRSTRGTPCRAAAGACDVVEVCDGTLGVCPVDGVAPSGTICRPAATSCDVAEACSGLSPACARDRQRVDGSACDDGLICNGAETCSAGVCAEGAPLVCAAAMPCLESTGACSMPTRARGGCTVGAGPTRASDVGAALLLAAVGLLLRRARASRRLAHFAFAILLAPLGACVCGVGEASCDDACVDVGYDESNCGRCGVSCGFGQCVEGTCTSTPHTNMPCTDDGMCTDASFCNGTERCVQGFCRAGASVTCDDGLACTTDVCVPTVNSCVSTPTTAVCGAN